MQTLTTHPTRWIAKGKIYKKDPTGKEGPIDSQMNIPEARSDIKLPDPTGSSGQGGTGRDIFGDPVNAPLAIFYMRKLWKELERVKVLKLKQEVAKLTAEIKKSFMDNEKKLDSATFSATLTTTLSAIEQKAAEANEWLVNLLDNSFGITMDKNVLLKTLSQPACEGIRFYLAMKEGTGKYESYNEDEVLISDPAGILTLVTVGVDKEGTDLHYVFSEGLCTPGEIPNVENCSLCTEYPRTPRITGKHDVKSKALEPYVLYKYAISKMD